MRHWKLSSLKTLQQNFLGRLTQLNLFLLPRETFLCVSSIVGSRRHLLCLSLPVLCHMLLLVTHLKLSSQNHPPYTIGFSALSGALSLALGVVVLNWSNQRDTVDCYLSQIEAFFASWLRTQEHCSVRLPYKVRKRIHHKGQSVRILDLCLDNKVWVLNIMVSETRSRYRFFSFWTNKFFFCLNLCTILYVSAETNGGVGNPELDWITVGPV